MIIKFTAFALVGAIGTLIHYFVLYVLVELQSVNPVAASGYGALAGMLVNYVLNYQITFKSQQPHVDTLPKFALIAVVGLIINLAMMSVLTQKIYYFLAQVLATLLVLMWNFIMNSLWTFSVGQSTSKANEKLLISKLRISSEFILLITIVAIRFFTLGFYPLYDPSESRYAEMGRKMLEIGNWITPMIDYGRPFWGKPPLTVWLTALSLKAGGVNDFSARVPSFLLGAGMCCVLYRLANHQYGIDKARNTVIILASSVLFFVMSGTVAMDQCMTFGITLALASFWLALHDRRVFWGYLFFIGLSIGLLAKGPIAVVLCGIAISLWTVVSRAWVRVWKHIPWVKGTVLMLCISIPWFLIAEQKTPGFLNYFIIGEHWQRFTQSGWKGDLYGVGRAHARGMIWIYWLGAAFPWSLLFLQKLISSLSRKESSSLFHSDDNWRLYCLLWMLAPLLFFTFSANLIWTYVLPSLPGFALLLSAWLSEIKYKIPLALCVPLIFMALVMAYHLPEVNFYKSQQHLVNRYLQQAKVGERLIYIDERPDSAQFYLQGKAMKSSHYELAFEKNTDHDFYVLNNGTLDKLSELVKARLDLIESFGHYTLYHEKER